MTLRTSKTNLRLSVLDPADLTSSVRRRSLNDDEVAVAIPRPCELVQQQKWTDLFSALSIDERKRMLSIRFRRDRELFLAAHVLLRATLSFWGNLEPSTWEFRAGVCGKPEITGSISNLRFSLSHTDELVACAVAVNREVGIDVERISSSAPLEIAPHYFSMRENLEMRDLPYEGRIMRFFTYWTLKEAYVKACGVGLSPRTRDFSLYRDRAGSWRIAFDSSADGPQDWQFWSWQVGEQHTCSVAAMVPSAV